MYNYIISILVLLIVSLSINFTYAHPWKVDSNWWHTCYTDCELYWLKYDEYHYHKQVSWKKHVLSNSNLSTFLKSELATSQAVNDVRNNEVSNGKIDKEKRLVLIKKIQSIMSTFSPFKREVEYNWYHMSLGHLYADIQPKLSQDNYFKAITGYYPACINVSDSYSSALNKSRNCLFLMMANIGAWRMNKVIDTRTVFLLNYQKALNQLGKTPELTTLWQAFQIYDDWFTKEPQPESASLNTNASPSVKKVQQATAKWTKSELQSKIKETEDLIQSWKKTYDESFQVIEKSKWFITRYESLNWEYESLISWTRNKYNWLITQAKSNKEIEIQSINATYARLWLSLSSAVSDNINNISTKYDKLIISLEDEMNYNIAIYQDSINRNNTKISENQSYVTTRTKKLEEFWQSIIAVEKNLEMYKSELAKL
mgnify:CR=1 FL=1